MLFLRYLLFSTELNCFPQIAKIQDANTTDGKGHMYLFI